MKFVLVTALLVVAVVADQHHDYTNSSLFVDYLNEIRDSDDFKRLPGDSQTLFNSLVSAAVQGTTELTALIDQIGFVKLLELFDLLDEDDIPHLEGYLSAHLRPGFVDAVSPTSDILTTPGILSTPGAISKKRQSQQDLFSFMKDLHIINLILEDLNDIDKQIFIEMMFAAQHDQLTQYIASKGYSAVLLLMSNVDADQAKEFNHLVEEHLKKEAAMAAMVGTLVG
ncbi:uncharacterized protein LOC124144258 [Haliotis rufescens]|uniref:uncharacterized protein LOC124144258 n=1 Tax=Haliotis rufescens TaxID=6454 RepID=UPI00201E78BE|nr:uncharacterized protein LOC124144258 [Haliotis rufescens]